MKNNCSKNLLLGILSVLFICTTGIAIYMLITSSKSTKVLDKYSELLNWCNSQEQEQDLIINCRGLLLNIAASEEEGNCFNTQIITNEKILKTFSFCGLGENLQYSNEILSYKKLLPIDISLTYKGTDTPDSYILDKVSITTSSEDYFQNIVNEDISELTTLDTSSTTIQNSVDFCPKPETLPSYITEENKAKYSEYYTNNILTPEKYEELYTEEYKTSFLENWTTPTINILFGCESSSRLKYGTVCDKTLRNEYSNLELSTLPSLVQNWSNLTISDSDLISLKNLSLVLDGALYQGDHSNYFLPKIINELFQFLADAQNNQIVYCSEYKIYDLLAQDNQIASDQLHTMTTLVDQNLPNASSFCTQILNDNLYDKKGLYLKAFFSTKDPAFTIYEKCNNLYLLLSNE